MPIAGLGLHILIALFFAVHAVRTGQPMYWLFVLFSFPVLGSIVYFVVIYLPHSRLERGARKTVSAVVRALDPQREVRAAREAFEQTPTAQNQMRLAVALLDAGDTAHACVEYETCLKGPFANDPEIRFGAARAYAECQRWTDALTHLDDLRRDSAGYRDEAAGLLRARALAGLSRNDEARREFVSVLERHGTFEAKAEYAIFLYGLRQAAEARQLDEELQKIASRWSSTARDLNLPVLRRLEAARKQAAA